MSDFPVQDILDLQIQGAVKGHVVKGLSICEGEGCTSQCLSHPFVPLCVPPGPLSL